ncbi:MAG: ribosome small subunit-dependent GTPase A [Phycisphaerae bacterium]
MSKRRTTSSDLTRQFHEGDLSDDSAAQSQKFNKRSKFNQQMKTERTAALRLRLMSGDVDTLPAGEVVQVFSLYLELEHEGRRLLAVVKKTLVKVRNTTPVVGDLVRFRAVDNNEPGSPEAVVEDILERKTLLTRSDSFKQQVEHPIVANAQQMLIVVSLLHPRAKWGLVDRMLIAAEAGGLVPILVVNKLDLVEGPDAVPEGPDAWAEAKPVLAHYRSLGIDVVETSVAMGIGIEAVRERLAGRTTVLAGHSGVGKSRLVTAVQPGLDIRVGEVSQITEKGKHTTTSARRYDLPAGGRVIDTPGVKVFGLWGVTPENLPDFFPDVEDETAPAWRKLSYKRIAASIEAKTH